MSSESCAQQNVISLPPLLFLMLILIQYFSCHMGPICSPFTSGPLLPNLPSSLPAPTNTDQDSSDNS